MHPGVDQFTLTKDCNIIYVIDQNLVLTVIEGYFQRIYKTVCECDFNTEKLFKNLKSGLVEGEIKSVFTGDDFYSDSLKELINWYNSKLVEFYKSSSEEKQKKF